MEIKTQRFKKNNQKTRGKDLRKEMIDDIFKLSAFTVISWVMLFQQK